MNTFFMYFGLAVGAFLFTLGILAFIHLKQGKVNSKQVNMFSRYANARHKGPFNKFCYFAFPLLVLFFWSGIGGLMVLAAMIMGIFFTKKLAALDARQAGYVAPGAAAGPIAGDPTDPRNIA